MENRQLSHWTGDFGDQYVDRNSLNDNAVRARTKALAEILQKIQGNPPTSILECGCNIGLNLQALKYLTDAQVFAVEPNQKAIQQAISTGAVAEKNITQGFLGNLPYPDSSFDLAFTSGVLIHIAPENLDAAMTDVYRVSKKYVLAIEYFSQKPETISYRGHSELLWKRDFGKKYLELFPSLTVLGTGFFWSQTTGIDDATWWLFQK